MLQTVLMVTIPTMVALTLAYLTLRQHKAQGESRGRDGPIPRPAPTSSQQRRPNSSPSQGDTLRRRKRAESDVDKDCVVCFERTDLVELYPCKHRNVCETCVRKLISTDKRICPLCRKRIQGYMSWLE